MPEIIGIDHLYITVSDLERSEKFYDVVMVQPKVNHSRFSTMS